MFRRERRRYLALGVISEESLTERDIINAIWNSILQLFGEYGASQANLSLIEYDSQTNRAPRAILRCSRGALHMVKASVTSITDVNRKPTIIHILAVSGTLKALRKNMF